MNQGQAFSPAQGLDGADEVAAKRSTFRESEKHKRFELIPELQQNVPDKHAIVYVRGSFSHA